MSPHDKKLTINIGGLESIASLYKNTSTELTKFNDLWKAGQNPIIIWDLRNIHTGRMSIAAISFFLAIAHRVSKFTKKPQPCLIEWNPKSFGFLSDIGFFDIADYYGLIEWPFAIGGYESGKTNPNTILFTCDPLLSIPDYNDQDNISQFKKIHRERYQQYIIEKCEALFVEIDNTYFDEDLPLSLSRTCAELATNSLLWGRSTPFVGLQRSRKLITISISDIGIGFKSSLIAREKFRELLTENDADIMSIAAGSIINKFDYGLKRAISDVIAFGGNISLTSNSGEICWNKYLWLRFLEQFEKSTLEKAARALPNPIYKADKLDKQNGYIRNWNFSIRGARVSFSIPLP